MKHPCVQISTLLTVGALITLTADEQHRFVSSAFKYQLLVPQQWNLSVAKSGVPMIFNYNRRQAGSQGLFPDSGAEIYIVPLALVKAVVKGNSLDDWIRNDLSLEHTNALISHLPDAVDDHRLPRNVVMVESDFERDPQDKGLQHQIDYYYVLSGGMYHLMCVYWKDNLRAAQVRAACESVFRSIRATP